MFDKNLKIHIQPMATVKDVKALLDTLPEDAMVAICGMFGGYIHTTQDYKIVSFDTAPMDEEYETEEE